MVTCKNLRTKPVVSANCLTLESQRENAIALASVLGLNVDEAADFLALSVAITVDAADPTAQQIAAEVFALLSRTVQRVVVSKAENNIDAELVIGCAAPLTKGYPVFLSVSDECAVIASCADSSARCASVPRVVGLLIACYASGVTLNAALRRALPFGQPDPFVLSLHEFGIEWSTISEPISLDHTYIAGAGAIGCGFLWAARHLNLRGRLEIVDDDCVSSGNLNRQVWFGINDIGKPKAFQLAMKCNPQVSPLILIPRQCRLQELPEKSDAAWLRRLIIAVDSRRARRSLQNEFPGEVFDASTTDIREAVIHHHIQPTSQACLSCIYAPDDDELSREKHIAEHFGISVEHVRTERISESVAQRIAGRFPGLIAAQIVGIAYDTLFKRLCAEGQLLSLRDKKIIAPFAFISVWAGTLLALEVVRRLGTGNHVQDFNYWRLSPWHPPHDRLRTVRQRQKGCSFCGNEVLGRVNESLWGWPHIQKNGP